MLSSPAAAQTMFRVEPVAARYLQTAFTVYGTREFGGCGIGHVIGDTIVVERIAPADAPVTNDSTVVEVQDCAAAGWERVVAFIHSHPGGVNCSHRYLGPSRGFNVPTGDWLRFMRWTDYQASGIFCGDHVAWLNHAGDEFIVPFAAEHVQ